MEFDPFARGPFPVGVRSGLAIDTDRGDRNLPYEVWYPAAPSYSGLDLSIPRQDVFAVGADQEPLRQEAVRDAAVQHGRYPLIVFSHASFGHRRQASFLCTHLASHGYVVAATDHTGNTAIDFAERSRRAAAGDVLTQEERDSYVRQIIADRVPDLRFLLDEMVARAPHDLTDRIDGQRVGLIGWSFGGWAVLATLEADERVGALVALSPAGNSNPLPGIIPATLTFKWRRAVPTLFLVAEEDRFTPLPGQYELFDRAPSNRRMFILRHADHNHFADQVDDEGLCPRANAHLFTRGLALAHMDAVLKQCEPAERFMADDPVARLRERGVDAASH